MRTKNSVSTKRLPHLAGALITSALLALPADAQAQPFGPYVQVDCSGTIWWAFPSIGDALTYSGYFFAASGAYVTIAVTGTCNENVTIDGRSNVRIGAPWGQTATINGSMTIQNSQSIYLYGLNVTNPSGDGITVSSSRSVVLDTCSSSGNAGTGMNVGQSSDVLVSGRGTFSDNGYVGIVTTGNSLTTVSSWAGTTEISRNATSALFIFSGMFATSGNTRLANSGSGVAIDMRGAGRAQMGSVGSAFGFGPNVIENNVHGGAWLQENSEISFWSLDQPDGINIIRNNGSFGVAGSFGSQITLVGARITDNAGPAVDVYAHSQLFASSDLAGLVGNEIARNGSASDPMSAAIRVDGNSQAELRGGVVSQTIGPAILALANSSVDFARVSFTANSGGVIACDSTSIAIGDLATALTTMAGGVGCKSPHTPMSHHARRVQTTTSDVARYKAMQEDYRKAVTGTPLNARQQ